MVLVVLIWVQRPEEAQSTNHLTPHITTVLSFEEVEENIQKVRVLVIGFYNISEKRSIW